MLKRTWHITTPTGERTLTLHRNRITGLHTLYADDEVIYKEEGRRKRYLRHTGTIDGYVYELATGQARRVGHHAYLIVNNTCIQADEVDADDYDFGYRQCCDIPPARAYIQRLANAADLLYVPRQMLTNWLQHRLIGVMDGYLIVVQYTEAESGKPGHEIGLLIRHQPLPDWKATVALLRDDPQLMRLQRELIGKEDQRILSRRDLTMIRIPCDYTSDDTDEVVIRMHQVLRAITSYLSPLSLHHCENPDCPSHDDAPLVLADTMPLMPPSILCESCATQKFIDLGLIDDPLHPRGRPWAIRWSLISGVCCIALAALMHQTSIQSMSTVVKVYALMAPMMILPKANMSKDSWGRIVSMMIMEASALLSIFVAITVGSVFTGTFTLATWLDAMWQTASGANRLLQDPGVALMMVVGAFVVLELLTVLYNWFVPVTPKSVWYSVRICDFPLDTNKGTKQ